MPNVCGSVFSVLALIENVTNDSSMRYLVVKEETLFLGRNKYAIAQAPHEAAFLEQLIFDMKPFLWGSSLLVP